MPDLCIRSDLLSRLLCVWHPDHCQWGEIPLSLLEHRTDAGSAPVVFFTSGITPSAMSGAFHALGWAPVENVAVKLSAGELPSSNYLRPALIAPLVKEVNGTIVECNIAYGGSRASTAMHYQVARDHGFTAIA